MNPSAGGERRSGPLRLAPRPRPAISRSADRTVTAAGLAVAGLFLLTAVAAAFLPDGVRHGIWLPLHLALAGAATTAIAAALPFFASSLLAAAPAPTAARVVAIALVAAGAAGVAAGVTGGSSGSAGGLAAAGGTSFVAGIVALAWVTFRPLRGSLGPRHALVLAAYAAALADVAVGATLATLYVGGYGPVVGAWASLKPVHAWLNLLGFVSLLIAGTLVHLYPTVLGTRIPRSGSAAAAAARLLVACLVGGSPLVAAGYLLGSDALARLGALVEVAGATALVVYAATVWRARGRWTTDASWHLAGIGHLSGGIGWFAIAIAVATGRTLAFGASPSGWSVESLAAPLALGWVAQVIVGAWTHLQPSIGPGGALVHGRQRSILGRIAELRLIALNAGTAALAIGLPLSNAGLNVFGAAAAGVALVADLGLLLGASSEGGLPLGARLNDPGQGR